MSLYSIFGFFLILVVIGVIAGAMSRGRSAPAGAVTNAAWATPQSAGSAASIRLSPVQAYFAEKGFSPQEMMMAQSFAQGQLRNPTTGLLFALFLGGIGAHKFYLGQVGLGIFYLIFCWTFIPAIVALCECFIIGSYIESQNNAVLIRAMQQVRMMQGASAAIGVL